MRSPSRWVNPGRGLAALALAAPPPPSAARPWPVAYRTALRLGGTSLALLLGLGCLVVWRRGRLRH